MATFLSVFVFLQQLQYLAFSQKMNVTLFALNNVLNGTADTTGVVGAQWIATQKINNNETLLADFHLDFKVFDAAGDSKTTLLNAIQMTEIADYEYKVYFPIVLGTAWSWLSTTVAPVFNAYDMGLISSSATSVALSDTDQYPYFYRTMADDSLQAQGLIILCLELEWKSIGIVYVNDNYGLNLAIGLQELAHNNGIDVTAIAISKSHEETYTQAAKQIKDLKLYIIILIVYGSPRYFDIFESEGIMGYPYYYIGVDAWFSSDVIASWNKTEQSLGFLGTVPFQIDTDANVEDYDEDIQSLVQISLETLRHILSLWEYYFENGHSKDLYTPVRFTKNIVYGYDAVYTIAYALERLIELKYDFAQLLHDDPHALMELLNDIITNDIDFIGGSGYVRFDENGDRIDGLYLFSNVMGDGNIQNIGYFYENANGSMEYAIHIDKIHFPRDFTEKNIIPQSQPLTYYKVETINAAMSYTMYCLSGVSAILALVFIVLLLYHRKHKIMRAGSWRLNIIMCIGAFIGYIAGILYTIDEGAVSSVYTLTNLCNIRVWLFTVSMTLLFMPLFMKTYRLSRIFGSNLRYVSLGDKTLSCYILICVVIDAALLSGFYFGAGRDLLARVHRNLSIDTIDDLRQTQFTVGVCGQNTNLKYSFSALISIWKICEIGYGLHAALIVTRLKGLGKRTLELLIEHDETGLQVLSIYFSLITLCIATPALIFGQNQYPTFYSLIYSISLCIVGNLVLLLNLIPRLRSVITHENEKEYEMPQIQKFKSQIQLHISMQNVHEKERVSAESFKTTPLNDHD